MRELSIDKEGFVHSDLLTSQPGIDHCFSTKRSTLTIEGLPIITRDSQAVRVQQVHGERVIKIESQDLSQGWNLMGEADAMVTTKKGVALYIKSADCVPILLYDKEKEVISAIHSGWRSTYRGVLGKAIDVMIKDYNAQPKDILMALGPCISYDFFEVGEEVVASFVEKYSFLNQRKDFYYKSSSKRENKYFMDLSKIIQRQAHDKGLSEDNIQDISMCSYSEEEMFYSYRRANERSLIWSQITLK